MNERDAEKRERKRRRRVAAFDAKLARLADLLEGKGFGKLPGLPRMKHLTTEELFRLRGGLYLALSPRGEGKDFAWDCKHDHSAVARILGDIGLSHEQIEAAVAELSDRGGHCDCEVMFKVFS